MKNEKAVEINYEARFHLFSAATRAWQTLILSNAADCVVLDLKALTGVDHALAPCSLQLMRHWIISTPLLQDDLLHRPSGMQLAMFVLSIARMSRWVDFSEDAMLGGCKELLVVHCFLAFVIFFPSPHDTSLTSSRFPSCCVN